MATVRAHLGTVDASAVVYRRAVDRLPDVHTAEDARRHLRVPGSAMLVFWQLACRMREPRSQVPPAELLADCLSGLCSRRAEETLQTVLAMLQVFRLGCHPRTNMWQSAGGCFDFSSQ